jgi:hypothetical protein
MHTIKRNFNEYIELFIKLSQKNSTSGTDPAGKGDA